MRPWVTFFSQTGTEINNLCKALGTYPHAIVTNKPNMIGVNSELITTNTFRSQKLNSPIWYMLPAKPAAADYLQVLERYKNPVITLHGYLRIIPREICEKYEIYNLHPGLIDKFPSLKGFNPQERAFLEGYKHAGCVIHRVVPEVDGGEILLSQGVNIENLTLSEVYSRLHEVAFDLWKSLFTGYKILEK